MNSLHSLPDESGISLLKLIYAGKTVSIVSVLNSGNNTIEYILTESGLIAGASKSKNLLQLIIQDNSLQMPDTKVAVEWALMMRQENRDLLDIYDMDAFLVNITNKGITKASIKVIGRFIKLVNDYRWQVCNAELGKILEYPSIKKLWWLYSEYVFWERIHKDVSFTQHVGALDLHEVKSKLIKLIEAFSNSISTFDEHSTSLN